MQRVYVMKLYLTYITFSYYEKCEMIAVFTLRPLVPPSVAVEMNRLVISVLNSTARVTVRIDVGSEIVKSVSWKAPAAVCICLLLLLSLTDSNP